MTYREEIAQLDSLATPSPWTSEGELYGVRENGAFMPIGFAPHRPLDSCLIAVYRLAVMELIGAVNAIERLVLRSTANASTPAAVGIRQVLTILDDVEDKGTSFRDTCRSSTARRRRHHGIPDIWSSAWSSIASFDRRLVSPVQLPATRSSSPPPGSRCHGR